MVIKVVCHPANTFLYQPQYEYCFIRERKLSPNREAQIPTSRTLQRFYAFLILSCNYKIQVQDDHLTEYFATQKLYTSDVDFGYDFCIEKNRIFPKIGLFVYNLTNSSPNTIMLYKLKSKVFKSLQIEW